MVVRKKDRLPEIRKDVRGGKGDVLFDMFVSNDKLPDNVKMFCEITIKPGESIGDHPHTDECEMLYVLEGEVTVTDNGVDKVLKKGDVAFCFKGEEHNERNTGDVDLKMVAITVTK